MVMKAASAKNPWPTSWSTVWVTARYMRLKQARPSLAGSAAPIASMRAIASAIEMTGPRAGAAEPAGMAPLYECRHRRSRCGPRTRWPLVATGRRAGAGHEHHGQGVSHRWALHVLGQHTAIFHRQRVAHDDR